MTTPVTMGSPAAAALPNPVFEGSEKRIEIDFYPPCAAEAVVAAATAAGAAPAAAGNTAAAASAALGLRALPRSLLDELMSLAACTIVSHRENDHLDAYVLSESSLFVYPTKWVLKTCGTTRLLSAVPRLLEAAHTLLGMKPRRACFTRASFLFPEQQPAPHTSFESEARFLRSCVAPLLGVPGAAYVLGDMLSGLQWHVYVADADGAAYMAAHPTMQTVGANSVDAAADALARGLSLGAPSSDDEAAAVAVAAVEAEESASLSSPSSSAPRRPTHKLEVCMTGLCPEAAKRFFRSPINPLWPLPNGAADVTRATGLGALVPRAITDDYIFEPCGYSMNGIDGPGLVTVHITPEEGFSYASVELAGFSAEAYDPAAMVASIASIFRPEHMSVSLSVDAAPPSGEYGWGALSAPPAGYACGSATCQELAAGGRVAYYTFAPLPDAGVARPPSPVAAVAAPALVPAPEAAAPDADADALPAPLERAPEPVRKAALAAMATRRPQSPATVLLRHMPSFSTLPSDAELFGSGCVTSAGTSAGSSGGGSGGGGDAAKDSSKLTRSKSLTGRALMASANRAWCAPIATSVAPAGVPKVPTPGLVAAAGGGASTPAPASAFAAVSPPSSPSSL